MEEYNDTNYNFISVSQVIKRVSDIYNDTDTDTNDLLYNSNVIVNYEI